MRKYILLLLLSSLLFSCSETKFLVTRIIDTSTLELEDKTIIKLIGVKQTTNKYVNALNGLENNYVLLYDENYDVINEITDGKITAYVYNMEQECINDLAKSDETSDVPAKSEEKKSIDLETNLVLKERISVKEIGLLPTTTLAEMYEKNKYSVFLIAVPTSKDNYSQGTGFFIAATGVGISNYHVFADGNKDEAIIKTIDNHTYHIKRILIEDKNLDYIIFEVANDHLDFPYLTFAREEVNIGNDVFAIGNPKGLEHTLSKGIISSYRENNKLIQTTTEITHGSSGGPLFNMKGEVIGITTSGIGEAALNFALNIQKLEVERLIKN